jgi:hypothetical protein
MAFYCFVSTTICPSSVSAFGVWIALGVIQAIYFLCALARFFGRLAP